MKKYIVLLILFISVYGCADIEEKPEGLLAPETFYTTEEAFDAAVLGCHYSLFGGYQGLDFAYGINGSMAAEDVSSHGSSGGAVDQFRFEAQSSSFQGLWGLYYKAVTNANAIISNLGNAQGISQEKLDQFEGQARFFRAFGYFTLTRYFGEVPLVTYETQPNADKVGQSPVADIYALIVEDLKLAEQKLPISFPEKGRVTKGAAKTLLAKVYLTMAGWPLEDASYYALARDKAKEVIDMDVYKLENNFADLWKVANKFTNTEFIFTFYGISSQGYYPASHLHVASRPTEEGGWIDFFSEERFFNVFPEGPRKEATFHTVFDDGSYWKDVNPKQPFIAKYRDAGPAAIGENGELLSFDGDGFWVNLRYADLLLIYAEAANMAEGGPSSLALECINKVRRRAMGIDPDTPDANVDLSSSISVSDFDVAVVAERNWELAFENNRWFDLVRKKMVVEVNKDLYPHVSEKHRLFPKPILEVEITEGLEQNPGY